jgi:hypothetical protein
MKLIATKMVMELKVDHIIVSLAFQFQKMYIFLARHPKDMIETKFV